MLQKLDLQQLQSKSLTEVKAYKAEAEKRKTELEALKGKGGKAWVPELQEELDDVVIFLVDADDVIAQKEAEAKAAKPKGYVVPAGTEDKVHIRLLRGRRYSSKTGKEISQPFVQMFSYSEYQLFMNNYQSLGYEIVEFLHNPYKTE